MGQGQIVLRGGSWYNNSTNCRCAYRDTNEPEIRNNNLGFRCASIKFLEEYSFKKPESFFLLNKGECVYLIQTLIQRL